MAGEIRGAFRKPFPEQIAALALRLGNLQPTTKWTDIMHDAHNEAFVVSGAIKAELIAAIGQAILNARTEGTGMDVFARDFRKIVTELGWPGTAGLGSKKGEAWRIRVIYKTNMRTSYAAGRWAQLMAEKVKFLIYRHGGSRDPRIQHLGWDGLVLPTEHPFWATHAPPNGWGCSCYLNGADSEREARRLGGNPEKQLPPDWNRIDPRTRAPVGIDKGWAYAPGASVAAKVQALSRRLAFLPERPSVDLIQSWLRHPAFVEWFEKPEGDWPLVRLAEAEANQIGAKDTIAYLSAETVAKQKARHSELLPIEYTLAQEVIETATQVVRDTPNTLVFVRASEDGYVLVVKATESGGRLFVTSFRRLSVEQAKRDKELQRLTDKG